MPIGPSHGSRGGGGFSRGSDGGRSRGSSSGGSFLGSVVGHVLGAAILTAGARRRRRRFEQRYGYNPSDDDYNSMPSRRAPTFLLVIAIIVAVISAFTMTLRNGSLKTQESYESNITQMTEDWLEYKELIENATPEGTNGFYKTTAEFSTTKRDYYTSNPTIKGAYFDFNLNGTAYYFIVYEFQAPTGHNGAMETKRGTTYSQFSASQVDGWNGQIAYKITDSGEVYSINLNYNLETCAEYKYNLAMATAAKESAKAFLRTFFIELAIVALFVVLYIFKLKKYKKLVAQDEELLLKKQQAEVDKAEAEADTAQFVAQRHNRFCQYCGGQLDADSNTCTSCGAKFSQE